MDIFQIDRDIAEIFDERERNELRGVGRLQAIWA